MRSRARNPSERSVTSPSNEHGLPSIASPRRRAERADRPRVASARGVSSVGRGGSGDQPHHVIDAGAEHPAVHDDEQHQRAESSAAPRRHGVGRAHEPVDEVGLAADLGRVPAREHRDEPATGSSTAANQCTARDRRGLPRTSSTRPVHAGQDHQHTDADHDAERQNGTITDRTIGRREVLEPGITTAPRRGENQAAEVRNSDLEDALLGAIPATRTRSAAPARATVSQCASIAAIFAGWCSTVLSPCRSPTTTCSGTTMLANHDRDRQHQRSRASSNGPSADSAPLRPRRRSTCSSTPRASCARSDTGTRD